MLVAHYHSHVPLLVIYIDVITCVLKQVIGVGFHMFICLWIKKFFFLNLTSDRLTFSNIRGRTSHQIYRLALPLLSPEMLSSLSKLKEFLIQCTPYSICPKDDIFTVAQFHR